MTTAPTARMTPPGTTTRRNTPTEVMSYVERIMWLVERDRANRTPTHPALDRSTRGHSRPHNTTR